MATAKSRTFRSGNSEAVRLPRDLAFKDWGPKDAQPIVFHHGWPLSSDDWDAQMMFFLANGYRVVAHDRRGHGRSSQSPKATTWTTTRPTPQRCSAPGPAQQRPHRPLDRRRRSRALCGKHGAGRVAKAVLVSAVPPLMLKTEANPGGVPMEVFDGIRQGTGFNRAQFFHDLAAGPFYGFNRDGAEVKPGVIDNWWRQGMMGSVKAHYEGIKAFSETDFTDDLKNDRRAGAGAARRGRPDRADRRLGSSGDQAAEERYADHLSGLPARHGDDAGRH
jgi:non-heme chloroperoxidase